jgi:CRP-like cAMP-binding protein
LGFVPNTVSVRFNSSNNLIGKEEQLMNDTSREEQLVDEYVQQDDPEAAVKLLYGLIVKCARQKQFSKAEALREKLMEIDPMALTEIIKTAEVIEEEKIGSMDKTHKELWAGFYDTLTAEETSTVYYGMKQAEFEPDQPVFQQGKLQPNLYFIDHGELILSCKERDREILLGSLGAGDIIGEELFFANTVCTTSLIPITIVKLHFLEKSLLTTWEKEHPLMVSKLHDYCKKADRTRNWLKSYQFDRRQQTRYRINGRCQIQIINSAGEPVGRPFYGELNDVSVGGLAFLARITKRDTARLLLGRRVKIVFDLPLESSNEVVEQDAIIVAVREYAFEDCSIHIKFRSPISAELLDGLS